MARLYKPLSIFLVLFALISCSETDPLPLPIVNFFLDPEIVEVGVPVMFDNTSTNASRYEWDFGDGQIVTEISPTVTFSSAGTVTVTLRAFTEDEQMVEVVRDVTIRERVITGYVVNVFPIFNGTEDWDPGANAGETFADIIVQFLPDDPNNPDGFVDGLFVEASQGPFGSALDPANQFVLTDDDWSFILFDFDGADLGNIQPEDVVPMIGAQFNPIQAATFKNDAGDAGFITVLLVDNDGNVLDVDFTFELQ